MFENMKIKGKVFFLVGFLALLLIVIGLLGLRGERKTDDSLE